MNILITGANGLLGKNLVNLLSKKHHVYAVIKDKSRLNFNLNDNVTILQIDLTNFDVDKLPCDIEAIYYLAQSDKFRDFPNETQDILSVNVLAPVKIADWAIKNNITTFIYASSGGVYTRSDKPVNEFFDINANEKLGFYLNSKLSAEMLLKNYANMFKNFIIMRPFFMYGIGQNKSMLIPRLISNIQNKNKILLNSEYGIQINPIYVSDAAIIAEQMLELDGELTVNIAGNEIISLKDLCLLIGCIVGEKPIFEINYLSKNDLVADISTMKSILCSPIINLKDGIQEMVKNT